MSADKEEIALYYEAKNDKVRKRLGIKGGFYWRTAKKLSVAISRGVVAMDDAGFDEEDFKKPVRVHLPVVNDLPPEGVFDTEFCNRYEKGGEDGITMVLIAPSPIAPSSSVQDKPASTDNTNVNSEDMTEIEENMLLPVSGQILPVQWLAQHGSEKPITHVSRGELRALHNAQDEKLPAVTALAISNKAAQLEPLEIRDLHKLVRDTDKVFPNPGNSDLGLMTAFFEAYLGADYTDRGLLTKEWMKGNRVSRITRTTSGANAGGGNKTDRNPNLVHTLDTLDVEIAAATLPMDFNIYEIPGSIYRRAKEVVLKKESPFKEWSAELRATPGILDYSRAAIFALIRSAHPEFYHYPGRLQGYINAYLTETDHENPSKETLTAARHTPEKDILEEINREVVTERETEKEKPQPSDADAMAGEQATTERMEPDTTEHCQDAQSLDAQSQVSSANQLKVTADEVNKTMQAASISQPDADKLLAVSRGEFVEGISDPNDPKWVKGIETRDSVNQNQQETEQNDQKAEQNSPNTQQNEPETKQPEPVVQQEPEKICTACGQSGGGNCPDCGAVMGDATYQETFDDKNQVEVQEDDSEKMEGAEHPRKENAGSAQDHASDSETDETADPLITVNGHHVITSTSRTCDHLMIDLETMGKNPDAPIISIGAIFFDPQTGDMGPEFSKTVDLETAGGVIDRDTIKWWLKQSREAQSAIMTDEIPLDDALLQLREFIDENSGEFFVQVWGNGATFDNVILRRSYERQGIPCPWRYTNDRDVRTMVALGLVMDFDARTTIPFEGERHNALHDARYQAKYVSAIWQKLIPSQADF
ncbi:TPA: 3'-5' exoribonuclease [Escherichia coli]|nr:3'-5' exoribonuclease [Escherichia coli]